MCDILQPSQSAVFLWKSIKKDLVSCPTSSASPWARRGREEESRGDATFTFDQLWFFTPHWWTALFTVLSWKTGDALVSDHICITATFPPPWPRNGGPGEPADRWRGRGAPADMSWPLRWTYQGEEDEMACGTLAFQLANSSHCQDECLWKRSAEEERTESSA